MDKINVASILTDFTMIDQDARDVSEWFEDESFTIRDPDSIQQGWLKSQGWKLVSKDLWSAIPVGTEVVTSFDYTYTRRTLKTELAMNALVTDLTTSFNEGRENNDQRYDDIIALYTATLDKTEDEINDLEDDEDTFEDLSLTIINSLATAYNTHNTDVNDTFDDYGDSETERINDQYDALLSSKQSEVTARGLYNTTIWDAIEVGIERERSDALTALNDRLKEREWSLKDRLYTLRLQVDEGILAARDRLFSRIHQSGSSRSVLRNSIIEMLGRFAERRTDAYPDLTSITKLATEMGQGNPSNYAP